MASRARTCVAVGSIFASGVVALDVRLNGTASPPSGCVDLDQGHAFKSNDVNTWPCVKVSDGAGTWTNIPKLPNILGKMLKVTVDLSDVGCRNNLAFQAVDADRNGGQYCDGQSGDPCVELDFMEANEHVWGSTIHAGSIPGGWKGGDAKGFGGDRSGMWNYGVNGGNVDTKKPIDLNVGFPVDGSGNLQYMSISMYQDGQQKAWFSVGEESPNGLREVADAVRRGLYIGFSYWSTGADGVDWFDKPNCNYYYPGAPAYFWDWKLVPIGQMVV